MRNTTLSDIARAGSARGPEAREVGHKDTVIAYPGEITRVVAKSDLPGRYVWHCHILHHEDHDMMRPFEVQAPTTPPDDDGGGGGGAGGHTPPPAHHRKPRKPRRKPMPHTPAHDKRQRATEPARVRRGRPATAARLSAASAERTDRSCPGGTAPDGPPGPPFCR